MKYYYQPNLLFHAQIDFDQVFLGLETSIFETKEQLFNIFNLNDDQNLSKFIVPESEIVFPFTLLLVDDRVCCSYSSNFELDIPFTTLTEHDVWKTVTNNNVSIIFSKEFINKFKKFGTIYSYRIS